MALIRFTPRQLEAFVGVAEAESFGEAAGRMSLTPSAVSQLIAELESIVGFRLFDRTTRRVALSAAGRDLLSAAKAAVAGLDGMERVAADLRSRSIGLLRVAAPLTIAATLLPPAIETFLQFHPGVSVQVCDVPVDRLVDAVAQADADLAIGPDRPVGDDVQRVPLFDSPWVLWCAANHALAARDCVNWSELQGYPLVAAGRDHELSVARMAPRWPEAERVVPLQVVEHLTTAFGLSASGRLATLAPAYVQALAQSFGLIQRHVVDPEVTRQVCLYLPVRRSLSPAGHALTDHLRCRLPVQLTGSTTLTCPVPDATK